MTDALLPPDPTEPGRYWLGTGFYDVVGEWKTREGKWHVDGWMHTITPAVAAAQGYTLASPHPIPTAAQLDALWEIVNEVGPSGHGVMDNPTEAYEKRAAYVRDRLRTALKGDTP